MSNQHPTVIFFGTCLINTLAPRAGLAAMRLLRRAGAQVRFPRDQSCCGQPAYNAGFDDQARRVARAQLKALEGEEPIIVPSASCAGMFRHEYPRLFAGTPEQAPAQHLAERIVELCDYLQRILGVNWPDLGPPVRVALHQSCSARREMQVAAPARALLEGLAQVEVLEPARASDCCGFGGTFAVKQPDISEAMTADKAGALLATDASVLVSQDLGCLTSLEGYLRRQGAMMQVQHIAEFLWERIASPEAEALKTGDAR
ncbi:MULTISPECIES: (Fe-S)-binding protein [Thiorhodovibrio]|uniref:(Fe-S)-binding protein n=1 Tax=Thiorhodovibrio TaxID=61593 RepID=UPI0019133B1E|nr:MULTISPECIES: (Fe-S)-binding protein [Thiorhodovibrio]MBK5967380.1 oxidoreductase [Thiorhodovibrio winogradskyi]WPL10401.1 Lactate utilization protein A [Thiorhodovibrio litoralis]